jgi:hypothetical protein
VVFLSTALWGAKAINPAVNNKLTKAEDFVKDS